MVRDTRQEIGEIIAQREISEWQRGVDSYGVEIDTQPWRPRVMLRYQPAYWRDMHYRIAEATARRIGLTMQEAVDALDIFFAHSPSWENGNPVLRTDENTRRGPSIEMVLLTARAAGRDWDAALAVIADRHDLAQQKNFNWLSYKAFWVSPSWGRNGRYSGLSHRRWRLWRLCINLYSWNIAAHRLPWSVLKGVDRLASQRSFRIARALLRAQQREHESVRAESFFRELAVYLRDDESLLQLTPYMPRGDVWFIWHNYVPQSRAARDLTPWLVVRLAETKRTRYFLRLLPQLQKVAAGRVEGVKVYDYREHDVRAAAQLACWLGDRAQAFVARTPMSIHDAAIGLPASRTTPETEEFLFRYAHRPLEAARVLENWGSILQELGWSPEHDTPHPLLSKGGMYQALEVMMRLHYPNVKHPGFARVAAGVGVPRHDFNILEDQWLEGLQGLEYQTVPAPRPREKGGLHLQQLLKDDPRAVFAGHYTGCCQHPGGAGASCAWHAHESPDGAIWAVERDERIIAQAWVWRSGEILVLDSVEASISLGDETLEVIKRLFQEAADDVIGKLGVTRVYVGTSYGKVHWEELPTIIRPVRCPASYSDSWHVWRIAMKG